MDIDYEYQTETDQPETRFSYLDDAYVVAEQRGVVCGQRVA